MPAIYSMDCDAWYEHSRLEPCVFGNEEATNTVVLLGDSYIAQWFSVVPEIYPEPNWRTIVLTKSACPIVDADYFYARIGKIYEVCKVWRDAVLDELEKIEPDIIVIGSASSYKFSETEWVDGTTRILERLVNSTTSIFLIPGTPTLGFDGPGCVFRNISSEGGFDFDACISEGRLKIVEHVTEYLDKSAGRFSNVHLLDLNGLVCPERTCSAVSKTGQVIYRDSKHLTDSFVRSKAPAIGVSTGLPF